MPNTTTNKVINTKDKERAANHGLSYVIIEKLDKDKSGDGKDFVSLGLLLDQCLLVNINYGSGANKERVIADASNMLTNVINEHFTSNRSKADPVAFRTAIYAPYWCLFDNPVYHLLAIIRKNFSARLLVNSAQFNTERNLVSFELSSKLLSSMSHLAEQGCENLIELVASRHHLNQPESEALVLERQTVKFINEHSEHYSKWNPKLICTLIEVLIDISVSADMGVNMQLLTKQGDRT